MLDGDDSDCDRAAPTPGVPTVSVELQNMQHIHGLLYQGHKASAAGPQLLKPKGTEPCGREPGLQ